MGFAFTQRSGIEKQVRDIAREQIANALEECREPPDVDFGKLVHGLRRRCKKLRGLLRLVEPRFKRAKLENRAFRDAAAGLSGSRDAAVMIETFEALLDFDRQRDAGARIDHARAATLAADLKAGASGSPEQADAEGLIEDFVAVFEAARARADKWELSGRGFDQIGDGLEDTYRSMRNGLEAARAENTAEALHEWRKDTKYHWHHVGLLHATAHDSLKPRKASLDRLGEMLGDHHNLAVLDARLAGQDDVATVRAVIAERQAMLAADAFDLGGQLAAEKPAMLRERFEQYWSLLPEKS